MEQPTTNSGDQVNRKKGSPSSNKDAAELFPVGKIVGAHALAGVIKVRPSTNNPALLMNIKTVTIELGGGITQKARIEDLRFEKRMLLISLKDVESRNDAEELIGGEVFTTRNQIGKLDEDEWWTNDLVGLSVYTTEGTLIGTVHNIISAGNELLEIKKVGDEDGETVLVPFVTALVPLVDIAAGRIEVVNLPGLLD